MGFYAFEPPDLEQSYIDKSNERSKKYNSVKNLIRTKPEVGNNFEDITNKWGNHLGRDIMVGSALLGYSSISPEVALLIERKIEIEQQQSRNFWEQTKAAGRGLVRNAIVGMDSLAEAAVKRPFQASARALIDNGMNPNLAYLQMFSNLVGLDKPLMNLALGDEYGEFRKDYELAKDELGPTQAGYAIRELAKGNRVNLGSGYFGNSTLARETDIYKELSQSIKDPNQLAEIEKVIQAQLGFDISGTERAKVEANKYRGVTISPGRVAAVQISEPGTDRYKFISGLIDGVVTLFLDPANLAGAWTTKLTKAGKTFKVVEDSAELAGTVGIRTSIGQGNRVYQVVRRDIKRDGKNAMRLMDNTGGRYASNEIIAVDVGPTILKGDVAYTLDELNDIAKANGRNKAYIDESTSAQDFIERGGYGRGRTPKNTGDSFYVNNIKLTDESTIEGGKFLQPRRAGANGTMLNNIISRLRGLEPQEIASLIKGTPLEKYFNKKALNTEVHLEGNDIIKGMVEAIDKDANFFKQWFQYIGADYKGSRAKFNTIEEVIDNTILHEQAHGWIKKGFAPKSISLDQTTIPRKLLGPLSKAGRRRIRDNKLNKARDKLSGYDYPDEVPELADEWAAYWKLEKDVNQLTTNFKTSYLQDRQELKRLAGLQKFLKPSLNKTDFEEWHTTIGRGIYNFLAENIQSGGLEFQDLRKLMPEASPSTLQSMLDNPNMDTIGNLIAQEVRTGGITKRLDPYSYTFRGKLSRNLGRNLSSKGKVLDDGGRINMSDMGSFLGVGAVVSRKFTDSAMARMFGQVSPAFITATSHTQGIKEIEKLIESLPFEKSVRKDLYEKLARTDAKILDDYLEGGSYSKLRLTEEFFKLLNGSGTAADAGILGELEKLLQARGLPGALNGGITKFVAEIQEARKYWVSLVGDEIVDVGFGTSKSNDLFSSRIRKIGEDAATNAKIEELAKAGKQEEIQKFIMATFGNADEAVPSAHLLSEMLVGNIPLFDPNDVFRILGTFRNSLLKMSGVGLLTGLKRFDLPQLLGKNIESNPIISLAAKNKKFADYVAGWELPVKSPSGKKVTQKYIAELQDKAIGELVTEYNKYGDNISIQELKDVTDDDTFQILNNLTTTQQLETVANVGNITSNAITKGLANALYAKRVTDDGIKIVNRAYTRFANNVMQAAWKPLTLLRFAWTTRVIMEEQLRMWASDLTQVFTHPISHLAYVLKPDGLMVRNAARAEKIFKKAIPGFDDNNLALTEKLIDKLKFGEFDILGKDMSQELLFKQAMSRGSNGIMIRKAASIDRFFKTIKKSSVTNSRASRRTYAKGWATEINQLADDDIMHLIANIIVDAGNTAFGGSITRNSTPFIDIDELAEFLAGKGKDLRFYEDRMRGLTKGNITFQSLLDVRKSYKEWVNSGDAVTDYGRRLIDGDVERTKELLNSYVARLFEKAGGGGTFKKYVFNEGYNRANLPGYVDFDRGIDFEAMLEAGIIREIDKGLIYKSADNPNLAMPMLYEPINGDKSNKFIQWVANRGFDAVPTGQKSSVVIPIGRFASPKQYDFLVDTLYKQTNIGPDVVKMSKEFEDAGRFSKGQWDSAIERWFDTLMSRPTNKLSRSPAFRQFYYRNLEKMADRLEADALYRITRMDTTSQYMPKSTRKKLRELVPKPVGEGIGIDDLEQFDEFLKSLALSETEDLLYSLNRRSQFSQATALLFPFAEVHLEIAGTWTRLLRENPTKARRASVSVQTLKEGNPFNWNFLGGDAGDDAPMIYTDERTNEEVFVFPLLDPILKNFFDNVQKQDLNGQQQNVDVNLRTVGFTSGVNIIAGGLIPGVGPVAQVAAKALMPNMKETGAFYKFLFPFGEPTGGIIEQTADVLVPPWLQKLTALTEGAPEGWVRGYTNTAKEVLRAKLISGAIQMGEEPRTQAEMNTVLKNVSRDAWILHMIKSAPQFTFTTPSFRWEAELEEGGLAHVNPQELKKRGIDPEGRLFGFNTLQTVYARFLNEFQDEVIATEVFTNVFGFDPTALVISKSKEIRRVPYTDEALDYAKENEEKFDLYPELFYYVRPDIGIDEFVMASWVNSFNDNYLGDYAARVDINLPEYAQLQNQAAGRMALERYRRSITDPTSPSYVKDDDIRTNLLTAYKLTLADYFVGYGEKPTTESRTDIGTFLKQARAMAEDPDLQNEQVIKGLKIWLDSLDSTLTVRRTETGNLGSDVTGSSNWLVSRDELRKKSQEIIKVYPLFQFLNDEVLERVIRENEDELIQYGYKYKTGYEGSQ